MEAADCRTLFKGAGDGSALQECRGEPWEARSLHFPRECRNRDLYEKPPDIYTAGWEELDGSAGLIPCLSKGLGWTLWLPGFSGSLTRWSGLGNILGSRWGYELASLLLRGSRMGPRRCIACHLGTRTRQDCVLDSLVRQCYYFSSVDGERHRLSVQAT